MRLILFCVFFSFWPQLAPAKSAPHEVKPASPEVEKVDLKSGVYADENAEITIFVFARENQVTITNLLLSYYEGVKLDLDSQQYMGNLRGAWQGLYTCTGASCKMPHNSYRSGSQPVFIKISPEANAFTIRAGKLRSSFRWKTDFPEMGKANDENPKKVLPKNGVYQFVDSSRDTMHVLVHENKVIITDVKNDSTVSIFAKYLEGVYACGEVSCTKLNSTREKEDRPIMLLAGPEALTIQIGATFQEAYIWKSEIESR